PTQTQQLPATHRPNSSLMSSLCLSHLLPLYSHLNPFSLISHPPSPHSQAESQAVTSLNSWHGHFPKSMSWSLPLRVFLSAPFFLSFPFGFFFLPPLPLPGISLSLFAPLPTQPQQPTHITICLSFHRRRLFCRLHLGRSLSLSDANDMEKEDGGADHGFVVMHMKCSSKCLLPQSPPPPPTPLPPHTHIYNI
ncbi:unnamed protein product, partial [Ilex paraguariensis]